jgi:opacity protein-like surface antigen
MILMKTFAITLAAGLMAAGSVFAQSAPAPSPMRGFYVGASVDVGGTKPQESQTWGNSLALGYELNRNFAVEAVASYNYKNSSHDAGQTGFVNLIVGQSLGRVTPYVLVGAGVGLNGAGNHDKNADALWNVGGGVAYNVTRNWQLDARYRYVDGWQGGREAEHAVSLGVNYKF